MRQIPAPPRSLVLKDEMYETTLRVTDSCRGEPYRRTLSLTFERGSPCSASYEHLASIELEPDEEAELRNLLNERDARR